jgi:hypothetical protein
MRIFLMNPPLAVPMLGQVQSQFRWCLQIFVKLTLRHIAFHSLYANIEIRTNTKKRAYQFKRASTVVIPNRTSNF